MTNYLNNEQVNLVLQHSLLKKSCKYGNIEAFKTLLEELDDSHIDYSKLLRIACQYNNMDIVDLLFSSTQIDHHFTDLFTICVTLHYNDAIKHFLTNKMFMEKEVDEDFYQDLFRLAIMSNNYDALKLFLYVDKFKITRDILKCAYNRVYKGYSEPLKILLNSDKLCKIINENKDIYNYLLNIFENDLLSIYYYPDHLYDLFSKDSYSVSLIIYGLSGLLFGSIILRNLCK